MSHYKIISRFEQYRYGEGYHWQKNIRRPTLKRTNTRFILNAIEFDQLHLEYLKGSVNYNLYQVMLFRNGKYLGIKMAVDFGYLPSAVLFKLSRIDPITW